MNEHRPSLNGCWERINRANENIVNLQREIMVFKEIRPYRIIRENDPSPCKLAFRFVDIRPVPPRFSVLAGEIVHHLRSSLDMLLYQLMLVAPLDRRVDPETARRPRPQFPILVTRTKDYESELQGQIGRVSDSAAALIRGMQPCEPGNGGATDFLAMLHELDIIDKHRLLTALGVGLAPFGDPIHSMKDGAYFAMTFDIPVPPEVNMEPNIAFEIAINEPRVFSGKPLIPTLSEVSDFTGRTLMVFAGEFKG